VAVVVASSTRTAAALLSGSVSVSSNKPTGTASGDLLIAFYLGASTGAPTTVGNQAGFTLIRARTDLSAGFYYQAAAYYRVADGSEGASFTFTETTTGPSGSDLIINRVTGAAASSFINASNDSLTTAAVNNPTAPSVTTTVANTLLLVYAQGAAGSANTGSDWATTASSGFAIASGSALNDAGNQWYIAAESKAQAATGATGTFTVPFSGVVNTIFQAITLAIAPPAAATTTPFHRHLWYLER
jgi:hypothetical protein